MLLRCAAPHCITSHNATLQNDYQIHDNILWTSHIHHYQIIYYILFHAGLNWPTFLLCAALFCPSTMPLLRSPSRCCQQQHYSTFPFQYYQFSSIIYFIKIYFLFLITPLSSVHLPWVVCHAPSSSLRRCKILLHHLHPSALDNLTIVILQLAPLYFFIYPSKLDTLEYMAVVVSKWYQYIFSKYLVV